MGDGNAFKIIIIIIIKGSIQQENITFVNTYAPNIGTYKYIK